MRPSDRINLWMFAALLTAALAALPLEHARAQTPGAPTVEGFAFKIYRVESGLYPFVQAYLRTFDQNQRPLLNLNYSNIGLMVMGRSYDPAKQQYSIQPLAQRSEAVRTVIVLDASKSMAGKPFEAALRATARYVDSKRPQDQVAILAIRDTPSGFSIVSDFERDPATLGHRLADVRADANKTRLYDAIDGAMKLSAMASQETAKVATADYPASTAILVFSDGQDDNSALSREELNARLSGLSVPIPIYSVAYSKVSRDHFKNLEALSKNTLGVYFPVANDLERMQQTVEEINRILLGDYVVTFRAYAPVDGEQHAFKLGIEYPTGSGKMLYDSARFEALEPPPASAIAEQIAALSQAIRPLPDQNPFLQKGAASTAAKP